MKKLVASSIVLLFIMLFVTGCAKQSEENENFIKEVQQSNWIATEWLINNFRDKGLFFYIYEPKFSRYPDKNNTIRQLMSSRILAELSNTRADLIENHQKNLDFIFSNWYKEKGDLGYILYEEKSKLGANAMALRTLVGSPFYENYKDQAKKIANGILSITNEDGSFRPWFVEPEYENDEKRLLTFYSGEALVALVEYYEKTQDQNYLNAAKKSQDFYLEEYVTNIEQNYYPAYVPWHTISLNKLYKITNDEKYSEAIFILNDKLLELLDRNEYIGRFYNKETPQYGTPHSSSDGIYTEGLAYAYEIAKLTGDKKREKEYSEALKIAVQNLKKLQYQDEELASVKDKWRLIGALRYKDGESSIRLDSTQHAIDAYTKILEVY